MKAEKFSNALQNVDDRFIAGAVRPQSAGKTIRFPWKRWAAAAACLCLLGASAFAARGFLLPAETEPIVQTAPAADSPDGMRRYMNWNGMRYEFLENGAVYQIPAELLGDAVGTLTHDIAADPEANAGKDLSSTYALGGTVYELKEYDAQFRVAVEYDGGYCICQSVAFNDGTPLDPAEYFALAGFPDNIQSVSVFDHGGSSLLAQLPKEETEQFVAALAQSVPAQLSDEQYQQIGQAQREGRSFRVTFDLDDGTGYGFYVIPSLDIAMFGDGRYTTPADFSDAFGGFFDGLRQDAPPIY